MFNPPKSLVLCDVHVHIYECFELDRFLQGAWDNFQAASHREGAGVSFNGVLLLTETARDHWFQRLAAAAQTNISQGGWTFRTTSEPESILAGNEKGHELIIVAGRQVVTIENLEVSALATVNEFPDGQPLRKVIYAVREASGLPVMPWGFGKWWGRRGRILSKVLASEAAEDLPLGDNSGRPWFLGDPSHFVRARHENRRILPGTDPLPFAGETARAGSVGCWWEGRLDPDRPAQQIRATLQDPVSRIGTYMHCERLLPFVRNQVAMQWRKHRGGTD